ncbi:hypothetical protein F4778DRAFT_744679 [Xylariomycetidae sp. FL2044]|nr:hypothetical protein F4778DRAFT_744679 [Xylariomycetidae sp. FL2044]
MASPMNSLPSLEEAMATASIVEATPAIRKLPTELWILIFRNCDDCASLDSLRCTSREALDVYLTYKKEIQETVFEAHWKSLAQTYAGTQSQEIVGLALMVHRAHRLVHTREGWYDVTAHGFFSVGYRDVGLFPHVPEVLKAACQLLAEVKRLRGKVHVDDKSVTYEDELSAILFVMFWSRARFRLPRHIKDFVYECTNEVYAAMTTTERELCRDYTKVIANNVEQHATRPGFDYLVREIGRRLNTPIHSKKSFASHLQNFAKHYFEEDDSDDDLYY